KILERRHEELPEPTVMAVMADSESRLPPTEPVIRQLVGLGLYDEAARELQYAQRIWGDSPAIQATFAWIYHEQGDLRRGINAMKRAYPQYLASGGEALPAELLRVLFPVDYWPLIKKHAEARTSRSRATTPARTGLRAGSPSGRDSSRTSSSTTSRIRRRRTTSSGSSARPKTTGVCTAADCWCPAVATRPRPPRSSHPQRRRSR